MSSLNKVMLIGNLGKDPEVRTTTSGQKVANFNIATTEKYTNKAGEKVESTEWHRIVIWGKLTDIVERYLKKGSKVYLEGKLATRSWEDDKGVKKYSTEVIVHSMQMLGEKTQNAEPAEEDPNLPF